MTEFHAVRIAPVLATDAQLDVWPRALAFFHRDFHELPDTGLVDRSKRILLHDFHFGIGAEERAGIIAAHAQCCLCKIVGPEAEELRRLGDFIGILSLDLPEWVTSFFGVMKVGSPYPRMTVQVMFGYVWRTPETRFSIENIRFF